MATAALVNQNSISTVTTQAQQEWAATPVRDRLRILRKLRAMIAADPRVLIDAISPDLARSRADTLVAEILPLLAACKFLEQQAATILKPRRLGTRGLPFWLSKVDSTVERVPLGTVLLIAPSNYPLFLPGVQALQALAAGNAVVWKPGRNGEPIARAVAALLAEAGLPQGLLRVTDDSVAAATTEIAACPDRIVFTGSATAGKAVLHAAADHVIPVIAELSGCDAVFVLPGADLARVVQALTFGLRLNGSATCMAPRRLIVVGAPSFPGTSEKGGVSAEEADDRTLLSALESSLATIPAITIPDHTRTHLQSLVEDAEQKGATMLGGPIAEHLRPILLDHGTPDMRVTQTDVFAPILTVLHASSIDEAIALHEACPYALTATIFGKEKQALALGRQLTAGTIVINDLIVPTADPRIPFGGRRASGFGVTRGAEGLLEMTAVKTTAIRRSNDTRHFTPTTAAHEPLFAAVVAMGHSRTLRQRLAGAKRMIRAAINLKEQL